MNRVHLSDLGTWDADFLDLAEYWANKKSKDPSTKVGAVITRPNRTIASLGWNGFARGVRDTAERLLNRELKYPLTVHAEINAILNANERLDGYTIYVSPLAPCTPCSGPIIQAGIARVVAKCGQINNPAQWSKSFELALAAFEEAGVEVTLVEG